MYQIDAKVSRIGRISAHVSNVGGINAAISLIDVISKDPFLEVTPIEAQWISVDCLVNYDIRSNTNWVIT